MKTIELPPYAPTLIESTRAIGYSLEAAIADIIDNSVAASAKNIEIFYFPMTNDINAEAEVVKYPAEFWKKLTEFAVMHRLIEMRDQQALKKACQIPLKLPNSVESKRLLALLEKARNEGFKDE